VRGLALEKMKKKRICPIELTYAPVQLNRMTSPGRVARFFFDYFMPIWYILWLFSPFWYVVPLNIWQPWLQYKFRKVSQLGISENFFSIRSNRFEAKIFLFMYICRYICSHAYVILFQSGQQRRSLEA
jgi:hypothetical protein